MTTVITEKAGEATTTATAQPKAIKKPRVARRRACRSNNRTSNIHRQPPRSRNPSRVDFVFLKQGQAACEGTDSWRSERAGRSE